LCDYKVKSALFWFHVETLFIFATSKKPFLIIIGKPVSVCCPQ